MSTIHDEIAQIGRMMLPDLRLACRNMGVSPAGSRTTLIDRLIDVLQVRVKMPHSFDRFLGMGDALVPTLGPTAPRCRVAPSPGHRLLPALHVRPAMLPGADLFLVVPVLGEKGGGGQQLSSQPTIAAAPPPQSPNEAHVRRGYENSGGGTSHMDGILGSQAHDYVDYNAV